jgi:hypothetical protein
MSNTGIKEHGTTESRIVKSAKKKKKIIRKKKASEHPPSSALPNVPGFKVWFIINHFTKQINCLRLGYTNLKSSDLYMLLVLKHSLN